MLFLFCFILLIFIQALHMLTENVQSLSTISFGVPGINQQKLAPKSIRNKNINMNIIQL